MDQRILAIERTRMYYKGTQISVLAMLSCEILGAEEEWSEERRWRIKSIVEEYYSILNLLMFKVNMMLHDEVFEPEAPLISELLIDPLEWLIILSVLIQDGKAKEKAEVAGNYKEPAGWTETDKENIKRI
jgi:hypothetical protein